MRLAERLERANPVLLRELASAARSKSFVWFVTGLAVILALLVVSSWPDDLEGYSQGRSWRAEQTYWSYVGTFAVLLLVVVPSFALDAVTGERASRTLDLLLTSPLTPRGILSGKARAALALGSLFVLLTLPFVAALWLLGGLPLLAHLMAYGFFLLEAWFLACLGVLASTLAPRTWQSAAATYLGIVVFVYLSAYAMDGSSNDDSFGTLTRLFVDEPAESRSYGPALVRLLVLTLVLASARASFARGLLAAVLVPSLLLATVALDVGERPFEDISSDYSSGLLDDLVSLALVGLRELWVVAIFASAMVGLARWWRALVPLLLALGAAHLADLTPLLSGWLSGPGAVEQALPLGLLFCAFALGLCHLMLELATWRLVPTHLWLSGGEGSPWGAVALNGSERAILFDKGEGSP